MKTFTPEICIVGARPKELADSVAKWGVGIDPDGRWDVKAVSLSAFTRRKEAAPITIVDARGLKTTAGENVRRVAESLAELHSAHSEPAFVILHSGSAVPQSVSERIEFLRFFPEPARVEFAGDESDTIAAIREVLSKLRAQQDVSRRKTGAKVAAHLKDLGQEREAGLLWADKVSREIECLGRFVREQLQELNEAVERLSDRLPAGPGPEPSHGTPRPSPLDHVAEVAAITDDLRGSSGRLSVTKLASLYAIPQRQIAGLLGVTPQAVSKTPDSPAYQPCLEFLERIARLRLLLANDDVFRKWLRTPNPRLGLSTPLSHLEHGDLQAVVDLVDDALTGSPG